MKCLLFLSLLTIGLNIGVITSSVFEEKYSFKDDPQLQNVLLESSKYGLLPFVTSRTRVRRAIGGPVTVLLPHLKKSVMHLCDDSKSLEDSVLDMYSCLQDKELFVIQRDAYIQHVDNCSQDTRKKLRKCLPPKLQYFPDFIFNLVESMVRLVYDDYAEIRDDTFPCVTNMKQTSVDDYNGCVTRVGQTIQDETLESKETFCDIYIQASECFVKQLNDSCTTNTGLEKFKKDFMEASKRPCKVQVASKTV